MPLNSRACVNSHFFTSFISDDCGSLTMIVLGMKLSKLRLISDLHKKLVKLILGTVQYNVYITVDILFKKKSQLYICNQTV